MHCARSSPSPVSPPYEIASVSKPIGATLLMQLVEQGRLSLDDPMSKYSRDYKGDAVRVRHVLTHTSEGVPGERYEYNGNLFDNLTDVAIAASVKRYRVLLADAIIDPLGMTNTSPGNDIADGLPKMEELLGAARARHYAEVLARLAKPYRLYGDEIVRTYEHERGIGTANGVVTTVLPLFREGERLPLCVRAGRRRPRHGAEDRCGRRDRGRAARSLIRWSIS
jgi:CubicO group peptidase (beta-lactamase class C family)